MGYRSWGRWQLLAVAGLLVIVIMSVGGVSGAALGDSIGVARWMGEVVGLVVGFLASRSLLRWLLERQLATSPPSQE